MRQPSVRNREAFALLIADVFDAAGVLRRYGERIAASAGQTQTRWQLLSVVSVGDWTVPMAADRLGTSRQAVQRVANDLVGDGLASFDDNPRHRRSPFLHLSTEGKQVLEEITVEALRCHAILLTKIDVDLIDARVALGSLTAAVRAELWT